ncbi:MAG: hypothetical protein LC808_35180, partial [Actinobacteria bacterium]|nr:hypothetical protein [Actinomycetota bacterium]
MRTSGLRGRSPRDAVSSKSSRDKQRQRSPGKDLRRDGRAISNAAIGDAGTLECVGDLRDEALDVVEVGLVGVADNPGAGGAVP